MSTYADGEGQGWASLRAYAPQRCKACGHPAHDGDPIVLADRVWVHESRTTDPQSGFYGAQVTR